MHIQPVSPPAQHGHHHKTNTATEALPVDAADAGSTDVSVDGGAVETEAVQTAPTGSPSDPLTPETAFNSHVIGSEGGSGHGKSPAQIARQLIAEGLTGTAASVDGATEGADQPFGQIVSRIARGLLTLEGARAAAAPAETQSGEVPADGPDVPADAVEAVAAGEDAAVVEEPVETAIGAPVAEIDDGALTEALLDMLNDEVDDGEADATPDPVTDTTGEEIV